MMQHIENHNKTLIAKNKENSDKSTASRTPITISVELEHPRPGLLDLLPYTDVAFVAKDFARSRGFENMGETLRNTSQGAKTG